MASDGREIEIKLPAGGVSGGVREARRRLHAGGFHISKKRIFEQNTIYDTAASNLRNTSQLLRLRQTGNNYLLTFKGAPEPGKHKSREEIETVVESGKACAAILERLGYAATFRYEKYRTEFQRKGSKGTATLDETPIGVYLELEGNPEWIDKMARMLGYEEKDYVTASYARLFFEWREKTKSSATDMLFG